MKIIIQDPPPNEEDSVTISVKQITENINRAINLLKSPDSITVYLDEQALMLPIANIFYAESVDLKTYVYATKTVYRSRLKLYELEELLSSSDFLRVSKQIIVNVKKIKSVAAAGAGSFSATLINGEKVIISRKYVPDLKARFGL